MEFSDAERNRHIYILGKTGSGKSTVMKSMALDDIERDECVIFIDPHGPDVLDILDHIPRRRIPDVCYLNLADPDYSVGFRATLQPQHTRSGLKDIWADSWGARLDWYLINLLYLLEANPHLTIANLPRLLYDEPFRTAGARERDQHSRAGFLAARVSFLFGALQPGSARTDPQQDRTISRSARRSSTASRSDTRSSISMSRSTSSKSFCSISTRACSATSRRRSSARCSSRR